MKTKKKAPTLEEFRATEIIDFDGGFISAQESEDGRLTAKIRIIKAGLSKNNRNYRPSALQRAAQEGTFDGTRMFVNHRPKGAPPQARGAPPGARIGEGRHRRLPAQPEDRA